MTLSQQQFVEFITPRTPHALSDRTWLPLPPTELKFETCRSLWQFPGFLDTQRVKDSLRSTLTLFPHCAGRLARVPVEMADRDSETGLALHWRINLVGAEGVQFSSTITQHPGIFRAEYTDDDLHPDFYEELNLPDPDLSGTHPYPLMKIKLTQWGRSGDTSLTVTSSHVLGDALTMMRFFETWSTYYQNQIPSLKPTFDQHLTPSPLSNLAGTSDYGPMLPMEYVSAAVPYIGFLAIDYPLNYMLDKTKSMIESSTRIDLKFPKETLEKIHDWALHTNPAKNPNTSRNLSISDALSAYLVYTLQKVSETRILRVQQIFGYRGMKVPHNALNAYSPPALTSTGNCFMIVSSKNRLEGSEPLGEIASMFRDTLTELRQPETFQKTFSVYSWLYERIAEGKRFPMEVPTEAAVQVNNLSKFPALKGHFGYPGRVRMYRWDSYQNFFEILPANPILTTSGEWIQFDGGVDVYVRIKQKLAGKFIRVLQADMTLRGIGELMSAIGPMNLRLSKL